MLFVAILETKEVSAALAEAGINAKQLASAVEEGRGSMHVDSATADTQVRFCVGAGYMLRLAGCAG